MSLEGIIMILLLKALAGAFVVLVMSWLSGMHIYFLVGLIPAFPTFTIIGQSMAWASGGVDAVRSMCLFGIIAQIPYGIYLLSVYILSAKFSIAVTFSISILIWATLALAITEIWKLYIA